MEKLARKLGRRFLRNDNFLDKLADSLDGAEVSESESSAEESSEESVEEEGPESDGSIDISLPNAARRLRTKRLRPAEGTPDGPAEALAPREDPRRPKLPASLAGIGRRGDTPGDKEGGATPEEEADDDTKAGK